MADDFLGIGEAATELSKGTVNLLKTLFGPATEEAGQLFADQIRYWRWKTAMGLIERAHQVLEKKGITPQQIPLKTLMPIMEGISVAAHKRNVKDPQTRQFSTHIKCRYGHA